MNQPIVSPLQIREVFHLEFLRWFARKLEASQYALKGGVNLRFFFKSIRYSEDMDIDVKGASVGKIQKTVMGILAARGFRDGLRSFGIEEVVPPDLTKAKQPQTTQRFKVHLLTAGGEDLFTKIEFSRRSSKGSTIVGPVSHEILRAYKMAPLIVSHYDVAAMVVQKIHALAGRTALQARDIFDLFILRSQYEPSKQSKVEISPSLLKTAHENIFTVAFSQFRDTVVAYFEEGDQKAYLVPAVWDEIKLNTAQFLEEFRQ